MALAIALGMVAALAFVITANPAAYGASAAAGLLTAWLVTDRVRGLVGLVAGIGGVFAVWGGRAALDKIESCSASPCSGITSPELTVWIAVGLGVLALALAVGGYLVGRLGRRVVAGLSARRAA
jgi:hypothetical protein